jgi:hypothetical protein
LLVKTKAKKKKKLIFKKKRRGGKVGKGKQRKKGKVGRREWGAHKLSGYNSKRLMKGRRESAGFDGCWWLGINQNFHRSDCFESQEKNSQKYFKIKIK